MNNTPDNSSRNDIRGLYDFVTEVGRQTKNPYPLSFQDFSRVMQKEANRRGLYDKLSKRAGIGGTYEDFERAFFNPYASETNQVEALRSKTFTRDPRKEMARQRALMDASRGEYNPYGTSEVSYNPDMRMRGTEIAPIDLVDSEDTLPEIATSTGPKTTRTFGGGVVSGLRGIHGGAQIAVAELLKMFGGGDSDDEKEAIHLINQMEKDGTLSLDTVREMRKKLGTRIATYTPAGFIYTPPTGKISRQLDALKLIEERMQRMGQDLTPEKRAVALDAMRSDLSEKGASEDKENPFVRWKEGAKDYMRKSEVPEGTWAELGSATASVGGAIAGQAISMIPGAAPVGQAISWASIGAQTISSGGQAIMDMEDYAAEKGVYISPEDKATISLGYMAAEFGGDALGGAVASKSISAIGKLAGGRIGQKLAVRSLAKGIAGNEGVRQSLSSMSEYAQKPLVIHLAKSAGRQIVRGAVTEGPGESLTTLAQSGALDRVWKSKEDQEAWSDVARQAVKDGIYGAWAGALMGGFGSAIQSGQVAHMHRKEGLTLVQDEKNNLYEVIGSDQSSYLVLDRAGRQKMLPADQVVDAIHYTPEERKKSQKAYDEATEGLHPKEEEVLTENQKRAGAILSATEQQQSPIYRATHPKVAEEELNSPVALAGAKQALADVLEGQNEEVKARVDQMALVLRDGEADPTEELTKLFSDESLSDNDRQSILDVVTAQSRLSTIERSHQEAMAQMQRELTKEWGAKSVVGDESVRGAVISATITDADGKPRQVYVTGGVRVVTNEDGTVELLPADDDAPIYVYDESVDGDEKGHIVQMDDLSSPQLVAEDYLDMVQASLDEAETAFRSEVQAADWEATKQKYGVKLSEEVDENGKNFVLNSEGEKRFGQIPEGLEIPAGDILLSEGDRSEDGGENYGLKHIEDRHGFQIRNAGYRSVVDFVEYVASHYDRIKKGTSRNGDPNGTYLLQLIDGHHNTIYVELSQDGTYWRINSAGVFNDTYGNNKETIRPASEVQIETPQSQNTWPTPNDNSGYSEDANGTVYESSLRQGKGTEKSEGEQFLSSLPRTREGEVDGLKLMSERPDDFIRYLGQLYGEDFVASLPLSKSGTLDLKALTPEQTLRVNEAALGKSGAVEAARQRRSKVGAERSKLEAEVKNDLGNLEKRMALRKASEEYRLYDDYVRTAEEQARQELEAQKRSEEEALTPEERQRREEEKRQLAQEKKEREERIRLENERRRREREELERNAEGSTVREYTEDPPRQARARGARLVNGAVVYRQEPMTVEHYADAERAFSQRPGETRAPVKRTIVEAESLQASHKEGRMNPKHFIPEAQPKDRADNGLSSTAADRIASDIRPDEITGGITAYTGAPVVNGRGEVIQGNNRTDALQTMYDGEERHAKSAELYKEYLKAHASEYGMTAEQVDAMTHPVAVDVAEVSDSEAIRLGHRGQTDLESAGADTMNAQTVGEELNSDTDPQSGQSMLVSFFNRIFSRTGANGAELSAKMDNMLNRNAEEGLKFLHENGYITDTQYKNAFETNSEGKRVVTAEAKTALKDVALYQLADVIGPRAMDIFYRLPASARNGLATFLYRDSQASFETSLAPDLGDALLVWDSLRQDPDFAGQTNFESAKIFILGKVSLFGRSELETNLGEASSLAKLLAASMQTQTEEQIASALNNYYDLVGANATGAKTQSLMPTSQPTDTKAGAAEAVYGRVYEVPSGREKHYRFRRDVAEDFRARRDALADRITEERRKHAAAMDMARTFGVPLKLHEDMSTLPEEVRAGFDETHFVKGWFYKGDNAVHIYLPANVDADDVRATFLHEAVGHYGCRELLGEVGYNQVLDNLANKLGEEEVLRAMSEYCNGSQDLTNRGQVRIAMDEWIAHRAESGITKKTVWESIKDFFRKVFGLSGKQIDQSAEMMADDLLRRSAENLQKRAERQQGMALEGATQEGDEMVRFKRSNVPAFSGPTLFGETDSRGVRQQLFNADGTPKSPGVRNNVGINVRRESLFADDTRESTTKKSETEGSPQTQEAKQAPKKTLKPSLFGEINKVVPLVSSGQVSIGDFAQTTVEKNSYGNVNSRRESPQNRSVGGEAREEAQRAEPKRVDRSNDGNRSYDQTGGRGLLELFDNEQVEKTSSPNPKERHSSGREESSVNERQKPIQDRKREDDTGSALPVGEALHPKNQNNYRVTEGEQPTTPAARYKANINAIDLYKKLSEEGRTPTKEEQKVLASYSGWGGLGQYFNVGAYRETLIDKLGKDGFDSAAMSVNSAYYTPFPIIKSLWAAARKLGFRGGKILESSAGIGNILAAIPDDVNRVSTIHAVEIDDLSGNILDMLYPEAKVDVAGFQNVSIAPGSIDLAITNVPFVSGLNVYDRENKDLSGLFRDLHDFVIAKNVRALRPGGLGVFITSSNTLDKSSTLKNWLSTSGSADVIGAFRLNNETFGGTKVTSDIIIIRKRVNGKIDPHAIDVSGTSIYKMSAGTYDSDTHTPITINTYFVNHPEFMGGEPSIGFDQGDTSYRPMAIGVYPTQSVDQDRALSSWVSSLGSIKQEPAIRQQEPSADYDSTDKIQGSILIDSSGRICCSDKGLAVPLEGINENKVRGYTKQEAVRDYVELKSALDNLIRYQLENTTDEGIETFIRALNTAYDTFVGKYGYLNDNLGISFIKNNDSEFASVAALEDVTLTDKDDKNGRPIKRYEKTEIFRSRQIAGPKKYKISNLTDGIQVSLYKNGSVDVDFIAESLGMEKETTRRQLLTEGLVYEDPDGGELIVSYLYQSGDIRQKIKIAEEALSRDGGERFESNLKALRAVVPPSIPAHLVPLKLGSTWAPTKLIDNYLKAKTGREGAFNHAGDIWTMTISPMSELSWQERMDIANKDADLGVRSSLVHKTVPFSELVVYALNNGRPDFSSSYKNEEGERETIRDKEATDLARQKIEDLREDYVSWVADYLQGNQEVAKEVEEVYNNTFNSYVTPKIPDNMLPSLFEGSANGISLYPHQKRAVLKTMNQSVMLAHEVGTGKTFTLISSAMEMRRLGIAKKPMIVVQNATIGQFASSAKKLYPAAKILALDDTDRGKSGRMRFYGKIKYADWDMVIVPQSTFELIANSPAREEAYKLKRIDEIEHVISVLEDQQSEDSLENNSISQKIRQLRRQVWAQKSDMALEKVKKMSEKSKQKKISNVSARIDKLLDKAVDEEQYFEDLGIDALLIDEAHNYKNLNFSTALGREIKGVTGASSKKAENVQIKIETIKEKNGGRNVVMATGTPISNTASELWVFMKYLMSEADMRRLGIYYFDDFVNNFGKIQTMLEFTTSGKFKANTRFAGYDGLPELIRIWSSVSDTVLTKEVGQVNDKIPEIETRQDQDVFLDQTPILHQYMNYVRSELEKFENMSGREKREKSYIPLKMFGKASAAAIDVRLVINQNIDDPHSKLNKAVDELYRTYSETKSYKGTAALFCDKYQNKVSGFNVFEDIKAKLVAKGIPEDQIEIMRPGMTDKKKQAIFDKVNSGAIRIIMGTTPTLGVGVNIQRRLHTLIHLDAPQRPMDYMQRNGRILRQGNLHKDWGKTVRILRFGVKDTLDVTSYQRLKTKAAFIDSIMNGGEILNDPLSSRTIEQEEEGIFDNPVAQLSGVESAMAKMSEERKLKRLRNKKTTWGRDQVYFNSQIKIHAEDIKKTKDYIEKIKSFVSRLDEVFPDRRVHNIKIDGVSAPNVEEAMKLLRAKSKGTTKIADKLMRRPSDNPVNVDVPISLDGHKATLSLVMISGVGQDDAGYAKVSLLKSVQFECPDLGISKKTIEGTISIPNAFEKVINDIISGTQSERQLNALTDRVTQKEAEKKYAEDRLSSNRVFPEEQELRETERRVAELTKQMDEELKAKEEKYATLDGDEETIDFAEIEADATDEEDDGVRFRTGEQIEEVNRTFNEELENYASSSNNKTLRAPLALGMPSSVLLSCGLPLSEITLPRDVIKKAQEKHHLNLADLRNLPKALIDPLLVYEWGTKARSMIIVTDLNVGDNKLTVAIKIERGGRILEINEIASIHDKVAGRFLEDMTTATGGGLSEALRYVRDKKKALDWLGIAPPKGASAQANPKLSDIANIINGFENPKIEKATHTDPEHRFRRAERAGDVSGAAEAVSDFMRNATPKNTTVDDVLRFLRVYHNSPHLLKKADGAFVDPETGERLGFDHRFMGSGEGNQAHGWGSYFSVKDLEGYASPRNGEVYNGMCVKQNEAYVISNGGSTKTAYLLFLTILDRCRRGGANQNEKTVKKSVKEHLEYSIQMDEENARVERRLLDALINNEPWTLVATSTAEDPFVTDPKTGYKYVHSEFSVEDARRNYEMYRSEVDMNKDILAFVESNPDYVRHFATKIPRHKYVVEIPDPDANHHYIKEDRRLTKYEGEMIRKAIHDDWDLRQSILAKMSWSGRTGREAYEYLSRGLGAERTSALLNKAGFVGIHYNGQRDGECYVIFNENDAKITDLIRYRRVKRTDPKSMTDPINPQWDGGWYSSEDLTGKSTADLLELPSAPATPEKRPTQSVAEYAETMSRHYADPRVRFRTGAHKENLRAPQPPRITDGMSLYEVAQLQHEYNRNYRDYLSSSMKHMDALVTTKGRFIRYMVDSARPVELFCKEMERMGIGMTPEQNIYQDMMTQSSRELNMRKQEVEPLVTKLTDRIRDLREQKLLDKVMDVSYTFTDEDTNETKTIKRADGYDKVSLYFQAKDIVECEQLGLVSRGREGFEKVVTEFGKSSNHITPEAYIASFEASVGKANAEALCDNMRKMSRWSIDRLHGAGLMTDDQYRSLTQSPRRYYAPQRGFKITEESDRNAYERVEMTAEGRQSLSGDPIAYMQAIMNTTVMRVVRNQDLLHLYEWVTQHQQELARRGVLEIGETYYRKSGVDEKGNPIYMPSKQAPTIEELRHDADVRRQVAKLRMEQKRLDQSHDKGETADYVYGIKSKEISNKISDLNNSIEILYRDPTPLRGDSKEQEETSRRTVKVYKDGVEQQIHFSPQYRGELVADVLNGRPSMDQDTRFYRSVGRYIEKAGAINFVSKATRFMSALMTQYNPNFAVTNALRDYGTALISNVSDFGWAYQRDFMANYAKVQKTVLKYAMSDAYSDGTYPSGKYGTYLKEFFDEGAATGWSFLPDVVKIRQTMKEMSDPSLKQKFVNGKYGVANAFGLKQGIGMLTEASELNTRFAEYVTSRERGYSSKEAAKHAKELTVNFNRKGTLAGVFGSFFGFWNASIQGTNKIVRLGKHGAEWCGTLFAGGLAQGLLYALSAPDKDDERAFTEWEMMTNLCMGDVKIPLPQGFRGFWGAGVQMALAIAGKKDWQGSVIDGMQYLVGELLPNEAAALSNIVEWDDVTGNVKLNSKKVLRDVVPTAIQPEMDVILNMDFMGNPVYREPFIKSQEGQIAQRTLGKKRTKKVYKDLSDKIWYAMGGSLERNDLMSRDETHILPDDVWLNPSVIEHVFEGRTTGVGKTLADIATCVSAASNGDPSELRKLQIVNVLTKQEKDYSDSDRSYWKLMDFYRSRQQTMSNLRKAKEGKDLERYKEMTRRASELAPRTTGEQLTEKIWEDGTKDEKLYVTWLETKALLKQIDKGTVTKEEVAPTIDRLTEQFRELR